MRLLCMALWVASACAAVTLPGKATGYYFNGTTIRVCLSPPEYGITGAAATDAVGKIEAPGTPNALQPVSCLDVLLPSAFEPTKPYEVRFFNAMRGTVAKSAPFLLTHFPLRPGIGLKRPTTVEFVVGTLYPGPAPVPWDTANDRLIFQSTSTGTVCTHSVNGAALSAIYACPKEDVSVTYTVRFQSGTLNGITTKWWGVVLVI